MGSNCTVVADVVVVVACHSPFESDTLVVARRHMRWQPVMMMMTYCFGSLESGTVDSGGSRRQTGDLPPRPNVTRSTTYLISGRSFQGQRSNIVFILF